MEQHIGLGPKAQGITIDVWWPTTDTRQHFEGVPKNEFLEIKEFSKSYTWLSDRTPVQLGGVKTVTRK